MEDTFSLGNVLLHGEFPSKGKENSLTGEMAELFISKIFGVTVLKLKYEDVLYPVLTTDDCDIYRAQTIKGDKYFKNEDLDELIQAIKKVK
ncbi:MAG: hypothetical protein ACLVGC_10970 [Bacteroides uniformis]|uniref:Uncharacterized protein n=1 Tax=Bacteroides intestinalis TaxID=329854 RepID=A0A414L326_9BACE|nr:hypothetical protein [Bacteroides intestinalis]RHE89056.1 hypothetical protein DW712_19735 [Bacteroides intestinalis]